MTLRMCFCIIGFLAASPALPLAASAQQRPIDFRMAVYYAGLAGFQDQWVQEVTSLPMKFVGSGAKSRRTGESVAMICVGQPRGAGQEPECDYTRAVYFNPTNKKVYAFGETWHFYDRNENTESILTAAYLRECMEAYMDSMTQIGDRGEKYRNRFMLPMKRASGAITSQQDWNWASSPRTVSDRKFLKLVDSMAGGYVLGTEGSIRYALSKPESDPMSMKRFVLNPYMVRLVPNAKNH